MKKITDLANASNQNSTPQSSSKLARSNRSSTQSLLTVSDYLIKMWQGNPTLRAQEEKARSEQYKEIRRAKKNLSNNQRRQQANQKFLKGTRTPPVHKTWENLSVEEKLEFIQKSSRSRVEKKTIEPIDARRTQQHHRKLLELELETEFLGNQGDAQISLLSDGGFVVAYDTQRQGNLNSQVFIKKYNYYGILIQKDFLLYNSTTHYQTLPRVASLNNEGIIVAWQSRGITDLSDQSICFQKFTLSMMRVGEVCQIPVSGPSFLTGVSPLTGGNFIISWSDRSSQNSRTTLFMRVYNSSSVQIKELDIKVGALPYEGLNSLALLTNGVWVKIWGDGSRIYAQRFNTSNVAIGLPFQVNTYSTNGGDLHGPTVTSLSMGGFVIAWINRMDSSFYNMLVCAQLYNNQGTKIGKEFKVSEPSYYAGNLPVYTNEGPAALIALKDGGFIISWIQAAVYRNGYKVSAQRYDAQGTKVSNNFDLSNYPGNQISPSGIGLPDGGFILIWQTYQEDKSSHRLYAQRFDKAGNRVSLNREPLLLPGVSSTNTPKTSSSLKLGLGVAGALIGVCGLGLGLKKLDSHLIAKKEAERRAEEARIAQAKRKQAEAARKAEQARRADEERKQRAEEARKEAVYQELIQYLQSALDRRFREKKVTYRQACLIFKSRNLEEIFLKLNISQNEIQRRFPARVLNSPETFQTVANAMLTYIQQRLEKEKKQARAQNQPRTEEQKSTQNARKAQRNYRKEAGLGPVIVFAKKIVNEKKINFRQGALAFHPDKCSNLFEMFKKLGVEEAELRERFSEETLKSEDIFKDVAAIMLEYMRSKKALHTGDHPKPGGQAGDNPKPGDQTT